MKILYRSFTILITCLSLTVNAQSNEINESDIKSLPDLTVYDLNGKRVQLRELAKKKVLFIDNWFIPCLQCFMEMPMLHKLYAEYANNDKICFITISRTDARIIKKFIAKDSSLAKYVNAYHYFSNLDYFKLPVYFLAGCNAKLEIGGKMQRATQPDNPLACPDNVFNFSGYPTVLIFDKNGKLIFKQSGFDGNESANRTRIENIIGPAITARQL
jgi:thiol-disulfide isomerase/thioredoxin